MNADALQVEVSTSASPVSVSLNAAVQPGALPASVPMTVSDQAAGLPMSVQMDIAAECELIPVTVSVEDEIPIRSVCASYQMSDLEEYTGPHTVVPSDQRQVLKTAGKRMTANIIVEPVPNTYGRILWNGSTLTIQ